MTEATTIPERYTTRHIASKVGKEFIRAHHYTQGCHNGPMCFGLFEGDTLIGVLAFATPSSENVRASVFGPDHRNSVTELHRLVVLDGTPTNTESWFIARALRWIHEYRPAIRGVLSFADSSEGHRGVIYRATNALFCGSTGRVRFYRDGAGRLRHPRQNGVNIAPARAAELGWVPEMREAKYRYLFLVGSRSDRKWARSNLRLEDLPYPDDGEPDPRLCTECPDGVGSVEVRPDGSAYCGECSAEWDA